MSEFIEISLDDAQVRRALREAPEVMERWLARGVSRAALEVANEEKRQVPEAFGTLRNSIYPEPAGLSLEKLVGPHVNYAVAVEEGTAGGRDRLPPHANLVDWIKRKRITPNDPEMTIDSLAVVMAKSIALKGTPANPFRDRTFKKMKPRVQDILRNHAAAGLREVAAQ